MSKKVKFFHPKTHSGWRKEQSAEVRRKKVYASTPKNMSRYKRLLTSARKIGSLCNVTQDKETEARACADAKHFYKKAREAKSK